MSGKPPTIGVLFSSASDRRLLRDFLQAEGYLVFSPEIGETAVADLAGVDLILVEGKVARRFRDALINLKNRVGAAFSFLPVLVAQPCHESAGPWVAAGFDDVIPLPIVKPLLSVRIKTWLRVREEAAGRFRALVEESPIGFYRTTPDGRVLYANPALVRLLGFSSFAELAQLNLEELAQRVGHPWARFKELLEREGRVVGFESVWVRHDGRRFWTRENARVVRDEFGRILYYEGTVEDITERVEAQQAYFTVVENSLQGIAILQDGRVVFGNPALEQLCGRTLEELMAMSPEEVLAMVHPEDRARVAEDMRRRLQGEPVPPVSEFRFIHKDGSTRWVRALAQRIEFAGRPAILASYLDITAERRLAERLNAVGELGRKLLLSRSPEEVAQAVVKGACALLGFTDVSLFLVDEKREELVLLAHSLGEPHGPRRLPLNAPQGAVARAARTGRVQNVPDVSQEPAYIRAYPQNRSEIAIPLKVGEKVVGVLNVESERPAAFGPEEERVLTTLADVAAVALENACLFKELQELRHFHEEIVQTLAEGVALVDPEGRITFANLTAAQLLGYEVSEVVGRHWRDFVASSFWEFVEEQQRRRAKGEEGAYEVLLVRKDGSSFPAVVRARPFVKAGEFAGSLVAFTDVSLLKGFEARYRYFAEQAEEGFYRVEFPHPVDPKATEAELQRALASAVLIEGNDALARHYGFSRAADLVGCTFSELFPGEVPPDILQAFREFLASGGRLVDREICVRLQNGSERWFSFTAVGFFTEGKLRAIWGIQRDITDRKEAEQKWREAEEKYRVLVEQLPGVVYLLDLDLPFPRRTVYISPQVQTLFGVSPEEWLSDPELWIRLIHPADRDRVVLAAKELNEKREPYDLTYRVVARDGTIRWIRNIAGVFPDAEGRPRYVHGILLDITAEMEARRAWQAEHEQMLSIFDALTCLMYVTDPQTHRILFANKALKEVFGRELVGELCYDVLQGIDKPCEFCVNAILRDRPGEPYVWEQFNPVLQRHFLLVDRAIHWPDGRLVRFEAAFDITEVKQAQREREAFVKRLQQAFHEIVEAFSASMDLRDPYTAGHQRRVAELACAIAEELGLPAERVQGLRVAALLHDIGKALFVPIEILSKPGKLTDLEMALIREHPKAGYEILRRVAFPWPVAEMVYQHHERLDGSGYPRGLRGEEILLEARILAVADVVEAMSSHRPYRPALGVEAALAEIREKAGKLYDPAVVEACLRVFAKGFQFPKGS